MAYIKPSSAVVALIAAFGLLLQTGHAWPLNPPFKLPATGKVKYMFALTTKPLPRAPKPPSLWRGRPAWEFLGGSGTLMVASYTGAPAPIGDYNELVYIPGKYTPCNGSPSIAYDSVTRIWVDSWPSLEVGRYMGGMPKYMASFKWHLDPVTQEVVNVTVRATNKTILRITGLKPSTSSIAAVAGDNEAETAATVQFKVDRSNVQWPIYPPGTPKPPNDAPLVGSQVFDTGSQMPRFLKADRVFMDAVTFTGFANMPAVYDSAKLIISAPLGTNATVKEHKTLTCP